MARWITLCLSEPTPQSTPMRRIRPGCCASARAATPMIARLAAVIASSDQAASHLPRRAVAVQAAFQRGFFKMTVTSSDPPTPAK